MGYSLEIHWGNYINKLCLKLNDIPPAGAYSDGHGKEFVFSVGVVQKYFNSKKAPQSVRPISETHDHYF